MGQDFLVFAIVIVPVLSVCLGFTVHYAIRPLIESLLDAIHDLGGLTSAGDSGREVKQLKAEVDELRQEVLRLRSAASFDAQLAAASTEKDQLSPGTP